MFVGHLAVALAAKRVEPRAPLGTLVGAAFAFDLIWPVLLLAGIEMVRIDPGNTAFTPLAFDDYPWSHSLSMAFVWAVAVGRVAAAVLRHARAGLIIGLTVLSHWVLDFFMHRPDLPLWPGGPEVGLGLWNSIPLTLLVEGLLLHGRRGDLPARDAGPRPRGNVGVLGPRPADHGDLDQRAVVPAAARRHGDRDGGTGALAVSRVGRLD